MGQTIKFLLFCLPWLFVVSPVSTKSNDQFSLINGRFENEHDRLLASNQNPILLGSNELLITEPSSSAILSKVHRSFAKLKLLDHGKRATTNSSKPHQDIINEIIKAYNFLKRYNYISHTTQGNHDIKTALETFQRFMHLPVTGKLDNTTMKAMGRKRCGVPDVEINDSTLGRRRKRFAVSKKKWNTTSLLYAFETFTTDMPLQDQKTVIAKAFKMWSDVSPLVFAMTSDLTKAHIKIMFGTLIHGKCTTSFDGQGNVLAHAFYPSDGQLHFDDDEYFTYGTYTGTNLLSVAVHEIGHTLGLAHSTDINSVMYPVANMYVPHLTLSTDDKNAIKYLYAGGTSSPGTAVCQDIWLSCASITTYCAKYRDLMNIRCRKTCNFCN